MTQSDGMKDTDGAAGKADCPDRPKTIAVGIGCEYLAAPEDVSVLAETCLTAAGVAPEQIACIATLARKANEPAIRALAERWGVPVCAFSAVRLEAETPRLIHPSATVFRITGCHGVAEGAALAAAGPVADLILPKQVGRRATCAIARAPETIDPVAVAREQGYDEAQGSGAQGSGGHDDGHGDGYGD